MYGGLWPRLRRVLLPPPLLPDPELDQVTGYDHTPIVPGTAPGTLKGLCSGEK